MLNGRRILLVIMVTLLLVGCAGKPKNPQDPYEAFNRKVFAFNMVVDKMLFRPVATIYTTLTPNFVQKRVSNVFSNVSEIPTVGNDILQGKIGQGFSDLWRFIINTTVGLGGMFDVAGHLGLEKNRQDFGLTLAHWGIKHSPYLVLPILGPSTARDTLAVPFDYYMSVYAYIRPMQYKLAVLGIRYTVIHGELLPAYKLMDQSFDPYVFVRNAYLQRRSKMIKKEPPNGTMDSEYVLDAVS